jgi:ubiquinone/menaquinone biosynthesis C-methylase UbiE
MEVNSPGVKATTAKLYKLEKVNCYGCGQAKGKAFISGNDDLTGKPGRFKFVKCTSCGLVYQNPRIAIEGIKEFYDNEYIAHRKKSDWGVLTRFYNRAMEKHDREKDKIVRKAFLPGPNSKILDVGCAVGTFLSFMKNRYACSVSGVDFTDLAAQNTERGIDFSCGLFYETTFAEKSFDLVTMWHFLEHDYDPMRSLKKAYKVLKPGGYLIMEVPRLDSASFKLFQDRWPGLQAPQHTVLFDKQNFLKFAERTGFELIDYLARGAFPAYFYFFAGVLFKFKKGKGVNFNNVIYSYYAGQLLTKPIFMFEKNLNLAMQTIICRKPPLH